MLMSSERLSEGRLKDRNHDRRDGATESASWAALHIENEFLLAEFCQLNVLLM